MNHKRTTLPNDYARCNGASFEEDGKTYWRKGCKDCLRRTAPRPERYWLSEPPPIIVFECENRIEP